eukprot:CAMPEP_0185429556 /NCGR_PEP_ID=MMETSP1365-20130426/16843_1 /TAXON_ID=38817 /ORGANISM="Gephyrocapsa oceanica, Strain RCC1303" /LENGTH=545 /DNA_ID=CAMNT_0028033791 /DNA_START=72 /DNA_END=1709 /DNA_ORIENTATION=+
MVELDELIVGDKVYFTGYDQRDTDGELLAYGTYGEVTSLEDIEDGLAEVLFPSIEDHIDCCVYELSFEPAPPLPGGFALRDTLYFTGREQTFEDGDMVEHGEAGEVLGPYGDNSLAMLFPGNNGAVYIRLTSLRRDPPVPLPGGFRVGELLYFVGSDLCFDCDNNTVLKYGTRGEVVGPALPSFANGNGLKLKFPGVRPLAFNPLVLSRDEPPDDALSDDKYRRARRALAARKEQQECVAPQAAAAEDLEFEVEWRQRLADELIAEEAKASLGPQGRRTGKKKKKKKGGLRQRGNCGAAQQEEVDVESEDEEAAAAEARRAERVAEETRRAALAAEAAQRDREEWLEREARAAAAADALAEREVRGERQQAARAEERKRVAQSQQSIAQRALEHAISEARVERMAARGREEAARGREEAARAREATARAELAEARAEAAEASASEEAARAREEKLTRRLAALKAESGPPPAANGATNGAGGQGRATLQQKVARIRTHLGLDADCSLAAAVTAANARAGLAAEGGLVAQVERLTELLFWDEAGGAA